MDKFLTVKESTPGYQDEGVSGKSSSPHSMHQLSGSLGKLSGYDNFGTSRASGRNTP